MVDAVNDVRRLFRGKAVLCRQTETGSAREDGRRFLGRKREVRGRASSLCVADDETGFNFTWLGVYDPSSDTMSTQRVEPGYADVVIDVGALRW